MLPLHTLSSCALCGPGRGGLGIMAATAGFLAVLGVLWLSRMGKLIPELSWCLSMLVEEFTLGKLRASEVALSVLDQEAAQCCT